MEEEKDEFLREIDELLGEPGEGGSGNTHSKTNGMNGHNGIEKADIELAQDLSHLEVDTDDQELAPKSRLEELWSL